MTTPTRRYEDRPLAQWRLWAIVAILCGGSFLAGQLLANPSMESAKPVFTSFFGGVLAVIVVWGGLGKQIVENLEKVASARGERVEELERELREEREERKREIQDMEARYRREVDGLTAQVKMLETQYQASLLEKVALQSALAQAHAKPNG